MASAKYAIRPAAAAIPASGHQIPTIRPADAAGLALSQFYGLLLQTLLDPALAIDGDRLQAAQQRLTRLAPPSTWRSGSS